MRLPTRLLCLALPLICLTASAHVGLGQPASADEDQAKAMLTKGLDLYAKLDFKGAQAALLNVNRTALSAADQKSLNDYLTRLPAQIRKQAKARDGLASAMQALQDNKLQEAKTGFTRAAASEVLTGAERADAAKQLALVDERIKASAAAAAAPATPAKPEPLPAPDPLPAPMPVAEPAPAPVPATVDPIPPAPMPAPEPIAVAPTPAPVAAPIAAPVAAPIPVPVSTDTPAPKADDAAAVRDKMNALIAKGTAQLNAGKPEVAMAYLQSAVELAPTSPEADKARALIIQAQEDSAKAAAPATSTMMSRYQKRLQVAKQAAILDFDKAMARSKELLARKVFDGAAEAARTARNGLETRKRLFTAKEYRQRLQAVEDQLTWIQKQKEKEARLEVIRQRAQIEKAEKERIIREEQRKASRIRMLTEQARNLRKLRKYAEAVEVLTQIVELDPTNEWAAEWRQYLLSESMLRKGHEHIRKLHEQQEKVFLDLREAEIPWWEILRYPSDWREITALRAERGAGASTQSPQDRALQEKLATQRIPKVEFADIELKDVISFLRDVTGLNIQVKWQALTVAGIDRTTAITVQLQDVTVAKALSVILDDLGGQGAQLGYVIDGGVITISTREDLSRKTTVEVYDIRDMIIRVPNFKGPRIELSQVGQNVGQDSSSGSSGGGFFDDTGAGGGGGGDTDAERIEGELKTRAQLIEDIITLITETIDPTSWRRAGGEVGAIRELHGQLVVTQTSENHRQLLGLIKKLREARALQISIEARFILISSSFLNRIGIDLDFYFNIHSNMRPGGAALPIRDPFTGNYIAPDGSGYWTPNAGGLRPFSPMGVTQDSMAWTSGVNSGVGGDLGTALTNHAIGLAGTFLDDIQVDFLIEATQATETARTLTAPRITLFNGQRAYITVATQQAYVANYEPVVAENAAALRPVIGYVPTGTVLDVEATVSADWKYVTMTVRPQVAELLPPLDEITFGVRSGNDITEATIQLPTVTVQDLQTTVSCPDKGTLLLGGQRMSGEMEREMGAPLLDKVPGLRRLFTNRAKVRDEQTLLILIKPTILIQQEGEDKADAETRR